MRMQLDVPPDVQYLICRETRDSSPLGCMVPTGRRAVRRPYMLVVIQHSAIRLSCIVQVCDSDLKVCLWLLEYTMIHYKKPNFC